MSQLVRLEGKPHVNMPYCTMEDNYSLTSCIMGYVLRETGCSFNAETNILNCERSEDVSNYFNTLVWAKTVSLAELHLRTNCLPKCSYTEYQVQPVMKSNQIWQWILKLQVAERSEVHADWRRNWISAVYLSLRSGTVELQEEYLVYDFQVVMYGIVSVVCLFYCLKGMEIMHTGCQRK